jgi:hypothetical protein
MHPYLYRSRTLVLITIYFKPGTTVEREFKKAKREKNSLVLENNVKLVILQMFFLKKRSEISLKRDAKSLKNCCCFVGMPESGDSE